MTFSFRVEQSQCNGCCLCTTMYPESLKWEGDTVVLTKPPQDFDSKEFDGLHAMREFCPTRAFKLQW